MRLKKGLPRLTSSKVVFRTFFATLKEITLSYSSCITDCQHDFEKGKHHEKHLHINIEAFFLCLWLCCYQWFLVLNP